MQNYWLGIMAGAFVIALAVWLLLVFNADRQQPRAPQASSPRREVIGGEFEAREGGRQVMPLPAQPSVPSQRMPQQAASEPAAESASEPAAAPGRQEATAHGSSQVPAQGAAERSEPVAPN